MNNTMYERHLEKFRLSVSMMMYNYEQKDVKRNHTTYGSASAYATVLEEFGHSVDFPVYGDGEFLVVDTVKIDGVEFNF